MNFLKPLMIVVGFFFAATAGPLKVIATFPDLKWAAEQIGGTEVKVEALGKGNQDPHHVDAKPSFMLILNKCDVFIQNGLEQEIGWVPPLLEGARNPKIVKGAPGFIDASEGITAKEIPLTADRSLGDVHPSGNPHFLIDPVCMLVVMDNIYEGLVRNRAEKQGFFKNNLDAAQKGLLASLVGAELVAAIGVDVLRKMFESGEFEQKLGENTLPAPLGGWMFNAKSLQGMKIICYHQSWKYFTDRFGMTIVGYLEPKPGIPPSGAHLLAIKNKILAESIPVIITDTYHNPKTGEKLAAETPAKALWLPNLVGGVKGVETYPALIEYNLDNILNALSENNGKGQKPRRQRNRFGRER
ncbi:MAG: zinc ABC transporter substrate-binding protein [Chitinispirillaceae bacterium]|nr:zinc ABC transporter substrate-binding protein [Chitinispirillaceae bacterium]